MTSDRMISTLDLKSIRERCLDGTIAAHAGEVVPQLLEEIERLKSVLGWYADKKSYVVQITYDDNMRPIRRFNPISEQGQRAREALK